MKITPEQLEPLRLAITPLDTDERRAQYLAGDFPRAELVKDLDVRYRWDLLWASGVDIMPLYDAGCHDRHVDTALRSIVKPLVKENA